MTTATATRAPVRLLIVDDEDRILEAYRLALCGRPLSTDRSLSKLEAELFPGTLQQPVQSVHLDLCLCRQGADAILCVKRSLDEDSPFSVALIDVRMPPGMDGVATAEAIRRLDHRIHIVIITAFSDIPPAIITKRVPPPDRLFYLNKPCQPDEIRQLVSALTTRWSAERDLERTLYALHAANDRLRNEEDSLRRSGERLRTLHKALIELNDRRLGKTSLNEAAYDVAELCLQCLELVGVWIWLKNTDGGLLDCLVSLGSEGAKRASPMMEKEYAQLFSAVDQEMIFTVPDRGREPLFSASISSHLIGSGALALAPIRAGGTTVGLLCCTLGVARPWDIAEISFVVGAAGVLSHVIERVEREAVKEQLAHDAIHDVLTRLPNRILFLDRLEQNLLRSLRNPDYSFATMFLDLDRFKSVNDRFGHETGDLLLLEVAERLNRCLRMTDTLARLGGDEFAIIAEDIHDPALATEIADRLLMEFREPFLIGSNEVYSSASIGIVLGASNHTSPGDILRDADTAMYRAKMVRNGYALFDQAMHDQIMASMKLENELRRAFESDEFQLHYQPILSVEDRRLLGFETLLRWISPRTETVGPMVFVPIMEAMGLIVPLGCRVLRRACEQARRWQDGHPGDPPIYVCVNLAQKQIMQKDLVPEILEALSEIGLDPRCLRFEITESVVIDSSLAALEALANLRELGIQILLDDFGTGYASLSYLLRFPVDAIKIDRSFIRDMDSRPESLKIVRAIVSLAKELGLGVVAEGIERAEQYNLLRDMGCPCAQGYLFSKPVDVESATELLKKNFEW